MIEVQHSTQKDAPSILLSSLGSSIPSKHKGRSVSFEDSSTVIMSHSGGFNSEDDFESDFSISATSRYSSDEIMTKSRLRHPPRRHRRHRKRVSNGGGDISTGPISRALSYLHYRSHNPEITEEAGAHREDKPTYQYGLDDFFQRSLNHCDSLSLLDLREQRAHIAPVICVESDDEDEGNDEGMYHRTTVDSMRLFDAAVLCGGRNYTVQPQVAAFLAKQEPTDAKMRTSPKTTSTVTKLSSDSSVLSRSQVSTTSCESEASCTGKADAAKTSDLSLMSMVETLLASRPLQEPHGR